MINTKYSISIFAGLFLIFCENAYSADLTSYQTRIQNCSPDLTSTSNNGNISGYDNAPKRKSCVRAVLKDLKKIKADEKACDKSCREDIYEIEMNAKSDHGLEDFSEARRKEDCDSFYDESQEDFKECNKIPIKAARSCSKFLEDEGGFLQSSEMQMAAPFMGMVNGADTLVGIYSAMSDKPQCYLSKEDYKQKEDSMDSERKDLEEKIKKNMEDVETAQREYADKLKEWADAEQKIADRLLEIPKEVKNAKYEIDKKKVEVKLQADSKYAAMLDQIEEGRRKYNDMVLAKSVALAEMSDFILHDKCAQTAVGVNPAQTNAANPPKTPPTAVQNSFAGAFAQGKSLSKDIQRKYNACMNIEKAKAKRTQAAILSEISNMRSKLQTYENVLGQINQDKIRADEDLVHQITQIDENANAEAQKLRGEYLKIQSEKVTEQKLMSDKVNRLTADSKKLSQQLAVISMKLQQYKNSRPPTIKDDRSLDSLMSQCGPEYEQSLDSFKSQCCSKGFSIKGSQVCKFEYRDYTKPGLTAKQKRELKEAEAKKTR